MIEGRHVECYLQECGAPEKRLVDHFSEHLVLKRGFRALEIDILATMRGFSSQNGQF